MSRHQIVSLIAASSVSGIALVWSGMTAEAASVTATVGVTIEGSGSVGTVTPPTTTTVTNTTSTTSSGFVIPTPPTPTATSSVGSEPVAPVATTADESTPGAGSSSSTNGGAGTASAPRFPNPNVSSAGLGRASAVAVAGSPNQAYSVMLPALTMYATSGQLVTLSNFQHNAGSTPFLGNDGAGFFNVGAQVIQSPLTGEAPNTDSQDNENALQGIPPALQTITSSLSDATLIGGDRSTVIATAFSNRSPYVNIVVSYN